MPKRSAPSQRLRLGSLEEDELEGAQASASLAPLAKRARRGPSDITNVSGGSVVEPPLSAKAKGKARLAPQSISEGEEGEGESTEGSEVADELSDGSMGQLASGDGEGRMDGRVGRADIPVDDEAEEEMVDELDDESKEEERRSNLGANVRQAGCIESLELVNFMCHRLLTVRFGPQINFIIGHNGSGKSAILTGITIALGGKASATNRGTSLKGFVKEGTNAAQVTLKLKNTGPEAYRPDEYGPSIIIERRINKDGTGGYKLKTSDGKRTIGTKREELNAICDHLNIQVDNPMNVLTQDAARQFLSSATPEEKYHFFLRGTQLTQLSAEYDLARQNIQKCHNIITRKEEGMSDLQSAAREAVSRFKETQKAQEMEKRLDTLKNEMVWAQVIEAEDNLEVEVRKAEALKAKMAAAEKKIAKSQAKINMLSDKILETEATVNAENDRSAPLRQERQQLLQKVRDGENRLRQMTADQQEMDRQARSLQDTIAEYQKRIDVETRKLEGSNRERREAISAKLAEAQAERKKISERVAQVSRDMDDLKRDEEANNEEQDTLMRQRDAKREEIVKTETLIKQLEARRVNRFTAFGSNMPALLSAIQRETRWQDKPIGPIGAHVRLKDMRWAAAIESVLSNQLNAFSVTNHSDARLLRNLIRQTNNNHVPIVISRVELFDYSGGEPDASFLTILRVLDIDDDFITRQLINSAHIERAILVERRADADAIMRSGPRNVQMCFTMDGFRMGGIAGGSSTQALQTYRGPPRLTENVDSQIQSSQGTLATLNSELQHIVEAGREKVVACRQIVQQIAKWRRESNRLHTQMRELGHRIGALEEEMRQDEPANLGALEEAKKEAEEELENIKRQFEAAATNKVALENKLKPITDKSDALRHEIDSFGEKQSAIQTELETLSVASTKARHDLKHYQDRKASIENTLASLESEVKAMEEQYNEWVEQASAYCERVETRRKPGDLEGEIKSLERALEERMRRGGTTMDQAAVDLQAKQRAWDDAKRDIEAMRNLITALSNSIKARLTRWHKFRRHIAIRAKNQFLLHLSNRGYYGTLTFNHDRQKLLLSVITDDQAGTKRKGGDKDPKALSGGEKSFSTVCLLLALWDAIGCPIRCLDEFDVFMDAVNRKISMKMMVDTAKAASDVQFILITPQNMSNVAFGPQVRVHRLADPERGQGVLAE